MKTFGNLFAQVTSFANLLLAAKNAQKGKKYLANVARFNFNLERELFQLQSEMQRKTYHPGPYQSFMIDDPKPRMISAAPYRDRVVHHALCNLIAPIFEKTFITDSYANRKGKGTHAAILRYQQFAQRFPYVLKCDIRKFFPSIDHDMLRKELNWKIACLDTRWLIDAILDNSNPQEEHIVYFAGDDLFTPYERRRGLPIGNLTSQWWGNIYLNRFDHFVKETLGIPEYIRYVDDFVLFSSDLNDLRVAKRRMNEYLASLRLTLHPEKTQIFRVADGVPFLGFTVFPNWRYVIKNRTRRYRRFLGKKLRSRKAGTLSASNLEEGLNSWLGHIRFGKHEKTEKQVFTYLYEHGVNLCKHPNGSWRVLEQ